METFEENVPAGWERNADQVATEIDHFLFRCERLSWGLLERGPVYILWEVHRGDFSAPAGCQDEGNSLNILATLGFSDGGAMAQAAQLGMPAFLGGFDLHMDETPAFTTWEWQWTPDGMESSTLTFQDMQPNNLPATLTGPYRFFWFNETAVSYADIQIEVGRDELDFATPPVTGTMSAPMKYAESGTSQYVGIGEYNPTANFSGTIHRFGDLACEEPLES